MPGLTGQYPKKRTSRATYKVTGPAALKTLAADAPEFAARLADIRCFLCRGDCLFHTAGDVSFGSEHPETIVSGTKL
jgi:hypothetical protein